MEGISHDPHTNKVGRTYEEKKIKSRIPRKQLIMIHSAIHMQRLPNLILFQCVQIKSYKDYANLNMLSKYVFEYVLIYFFDS